MLLCVQEEATESVLTEIILLTCTLPVWGWHHFFSLPESPRGHCWGKSWGTVGGRPQHPLSIDS